MKKQIYIDKMHCASCEKLLDNEFRKLSGFRNAKFDRNNDSAQIEYDQKVLSFEKIQKAARELGYGVSESSPDKSLEVKGPSDRKRDKTSLFQWINSIVIVVFILLLYRIFQNLGFLDKIDLQGNGVGFGVAFVVGIVASLSSCLAVVGAVVIAFGEKYKNDGGSFYDSAVKPNLLFHIGRIGTFFLLGGILGAIGGEISISGNFISIFTIVISAVMLWLGLNILGFVPNIGRIGIRMPLFLTSKWSNLEKSEHKLAPFLLGGLTFFLPCGFTQSMQILALASGSFLSGALMLSIFALGTLPVLILLGITTSWTENKKMVVFKKVAGMLIIIFAVFTFNSAMALRGVKTSVISSDKKVEENTPVANNPSQNSQQVVTMKITSRGFEPSVIKIKSGVPVKWVIQGDQVSGCTNKIIIPSLDISKDIKFGENIVSFTPTKKGDLPFSCWMGMVRGKFIVE